jgi:outer membrane protein OmpA-like peptidoglycan-associated protein
MAESTLSFGNSEFFRKNLLTKNLEPYSVQGVLSARQPAVNYETNLSVYSVIDSPNTFVSTNTFANAQYPLNVFGPEGGFNEPIGIGPLSSSQLPNGSNQGPYTQDSAQIDLLNEFFIDAAYIKNIWGPSGGYKDLVIITDIQNNNNIYQPYWDPSYFVSSSYSTYDVVFQIDPLGSDGLLSQDTYLAKIGAAQLKGLFEERIAAEIAQATVGAINLDTLTDPFTASQLATGQQPFFDRNWKISQPENIVLATVSLANRISGTYFPASFIPGDYFEEVNPYTNPAQTSNALNIVNNLTGGLISPILNKTRNPSEVFVANTGNGQRSVLFASLDYNKYRPAYNRGIIGGAETLINNFIDQDTPSQGGYYVGSKNAEPSMIDSPANQVPVNEFGEQVATIVYGPQELGILYEGNIGRIQNGLAGKAYSNDGGISGQFVWTSPKYKDNAGFKVGKGGEVKSYDQEFPTIQSDYNKYQSTDIDFRPGSILDNTQRLVESADQVQGQTRLKHVGTAINQVSKVFNDGYKEITKGSQVFSYTDQTSGQEAGIEYCRLFTKDTPYFFYGDLQKTDGITQNGRRFGFSVLDNTYNLNIAPLRNPGSTNIVNGKVKKYMFSIENLAWRTSDRPGFTYDDLPVCEKGPNGGRIMWFPPYNLKFNDDSKPNFNETTFIGRPEPIYTYKNTSRSGSISWSIIVDHPSMMNTIIEKQLANTPKERIDSIMDSFFAGCVKYDIYELAIKFNTISPSDLFTYQEILNNPRLTPEELTSTLVEIPVNSQGNTPNSAIGGDGPPNQVGPEANTTIQDPVTTVLDQYVGYGFYFDNDYPDPNTRRTTATQPYNVWYDQYTAPGVKTTYQGNTAPAKVFVGNKEFKRDGIGNFYTEVIEGNFKFIQQNLLKEIADTLINDGTVEIELVGSASAPNSPEYNTNLSERRIDSVIQWFNAQPLPTNNKIGDFAGSIGRIKYIVPPENIRGENLVIPKSKADAVNTSGITVTTSGGTEVLNEEVNCTVNIRQNAVNGPVTSASQKYSIPAMACRRVAIKKITVTRKPQETPPEQTVIDDNKQTDQSVVKTGITQTIKPQGRVDVITKIKEGISKKILRNLFTECDYFEVIKESNPMIFDSIKDKIKYFNPAFHSMTPEGLNARLTFLNQCMRPGQTIPVIDTDGKPKYNDALNTAFGAPPILVLRVGDFYHTKIVPQNLSITYDPLQLDMNPEGIGIQPMVANVTLGFNFIGGHGLAGPVQELQNALSFNYYANTEIYDERATATEDTSERDKYVVEKITGGITPVSSAQASAVQNTDPKRGQQTIGTQVGDVLDYTPVLKELQDQLKGYFDTYFNGELKVQQQSNYGILQIMNNKRKYSKGSLGEFSTPIKEVELYGKPSDYENLIDGLVNQIITDIDDQMDPISAGLKADPANFPNKALREVKDRLKTLVETQKVELRNIVNNGFADLVDSQEELIYTFRKLNVVDSKLDGYMDASNGTVTFDLSGDTFFGDITSQDSLKYVFLDRVPDYLTKLNTFMSGTLITEPSKFDTTQYTINDPFTGNFITIQENRFYVCNSNIFLDEGKFRDFVNALTTLEEVKKIPEMVVKVEEICNKLKTIFKEEFDAEVKNFDTAKLDPIYTQLTTLELPVIPAKVGFVSPSTTDVEAKQNRLKDLYANQNLNTTDTFDGKVTLN